MMRVMAATNERRPATRAVGRKGSRDRSTDRIRHLVAFSPEYFGDSEDTVTSDRAAPPALVVGSTPTCHLTMTVAQLQTPCPLLAPCGPEGSASRQSLHARRHLLQFNFEGSENAVTSGRRASAMVRIHRHRVRPISLVSISQAVRIRILHVVGSTPAPQG